MLKEGMKHQEVKEKLHQYSKPHRDQVKDSMINQVRIAEGEESAQDLKHDIDHIGWKGGCHTNFTDLKTMSVAGGPSACNSCKHDINRGSFGCPDCIPHSDIKSKWEPREV